MDIAGHVGSSVLSAIRLASFVGGGEIVTRCDNSCLPVIGSFGQIAPPAPMYPEGIGAVYGFAQFAVNTVLSGAFVALSLTLPMNCVGYVVFKILQVIAVAAITAAIMPMWTGECIKKLAQGDALKLTTETAIVSIIIQFLADAAWNVLLG